MSGIKYAYSYKRSSAFLGSFDSVQEALEDADNNYGDSTEAYTVYVGQIDSVNLEDYAPQADDTLEGMLEVAYDHLSETLYEALWDRVESLEHEALNELSDELEQCIKEWADDYQVTDGLSKIVCIERYEIGEAKA